MPQTRDTRPRQLVRGDQSENAVERDAGRGMTARKGIPGRVDHGVLTGRTIARHDVLDQRDGPLARRDRHRKGQGAVPVPADRQRRRGQRGESQDGVRCGKIGERAHRRGPQRDGEPVGMRHGDALDPRQAGVDVGREREDRDDCQRRERQHRLDDATGAARPHGSGW